MSKLRVNTKKVVNTISPVLYGIFFEDINYGGDGGWYGELIPNRSFEFYDRNDKTDKHKMCWETFDDAEFEIKTESPLNNVHTHYACISGNGSIRNIGYCKSGFNVSDGDEMRFSCYTSSDKDVEFAVTITDNSGTVFGKAELCSTKGTWHKHEEIIHISGNCKNAVLEVSLTNGGTLNLEFVSLFNNDTFRGHKNGLRKDLSELLEDLKPKFVRFPGGCIVEGRSFENMYNWKDTIGPVEERRTNWNRWQDKQYQQNEQGSDDYFQSYGLGFFEYFEFCEDIGAKPLPVVNCGMTCQWHEALLVDLEKLEPFVQDVFDLIEFANGTDENNIWVKKRIEMGHKEPFGLEYIGIGNEQWGNEYFERYEIFAKAVGEKYPEIKLVTSAGWKDRGEDFDLAYDWMSKNKDKAYAVDEHFYKEPEWFLNNISRYDNYDRSLPKVFIGEYASHTARELKEKRNNWHSALSEAAFLTGVERNADHVVMTCYAPLLAREEYNQWQPNLIWFDNETAYGTPNYYIQKLFGEYVGDYAVEYECDDEDIKVSASKTNDSRLIIKVVNVSDKNKILELKTDFNADKCKVIEMCAELDAENSLQNPRNVYPTEYERDFYEKFKIKGNSVTVIDVRA